MRAAALQPLGVEVTDVALGHLAPHEVAQVKELLAEHGVAVFPGQEIGDAAFRDFLRGFGELVFTVGETPVPGSPDLNVITNVGRTSPPTSTFHVDSSYLRDPPAYTALRAVRIPDEGGETLFTDQYAAYEALPAATVDRLRDRTITHVVTGVEIGPDDESEAEHPVFAVHPRSGRTSLYLTTPKRCATVSGLSDDEAADVVRELYAVSTAPERTVRHRWARGDVVMWDNRCVLHKADHSGVVGDRVMHRGMATDRP